MDYAVAAVRATEDARIWAETAVPGDAVDPADPRDALSPESWVLGGASPPLVRRVVPVETEGGRSAFWLDLDASLTPGQSYTLALAPLARSANGEPTSTAEVTFVARTPLARTGTIPGEPAADVEMPVATQGGDPRGLPPLEALRERVRLLARARRGAFTHAPTFGRGVEPKRTYSEARLQQESADLAAELRRDPDVRSASVAVTKGSDHLTRFEITVEPAVGQPFVITERITAGGES